jgi:hypothetical protein
MLRAGGVIGDLWIDGSFLTQKIDAKDVDVVLRIDAAVYDGGPQALRDAVDSLNSNLKASHHCDSYVYPVWPKEHARFWFGEYMYAYWLKLYGFNRPGSTMKGIAVVRLP